MHGMNDEVDMRHYGALRSCMVLTWATFGLGYLAIIGIPPFAGFFSKDEIIQAALARASGGRPRRTARRRGDGLLHDPHGDHDLLRQGALGRRLAPARVAAGR